MCFYGIAMVYDAKPCWKTCCVYEWRAHKRTVPAKYHQRQIHRETIPRTKGMGIMTAAIHANNVLAHVYPKLLYICVVKSGNAIAARFPNVRS